MEGVVIGEATFTINKYPPVSIAVVCGKDFTYNGKHQKPAKSDSKAVSSPR